MIVTADTKIEELGTDPNFAQHSLRPVPLMQLQEILAKQQEQQHMRTVYGDASSQAGFNVDVIGIILDAGQMQSQHDRTLGKLAAARLKCRTCC